MHNMANIPPLAAKKLVFNGQVKEVFGSIERIATPDDKRINKITDPEPYLVVRFTYGNIEYRGLWKQDDCLLLT